MRHNLLVRKFAAGIAFITFIFVYYVAFWFDIPGLHVNDSNIDKLLSEILVTPAIQLELLRTALTHLVLLALCFALVLWVADHVARVTRLRRMLVRVVMLIAAWLTLTRVNTVLFPLSEYSIVWDTRGFPVIAGIGGVVLACSLALALVKTHWRNHWRFGAVLVAIAAISFTATRWVQPAHAAASTKRNVVIVGIDSLSDQMATAMLPNLPHLAALLDHSERFKRAYTPLGRTYPAWVSILSGQTPAVHGALFNLRGLAHTQKRHLVSEELQQAGYQTVFAMDERRFANLDESFGFDRVIGPKDGVLDFMLQRVNDTPLTNLLLQTPVAHYLLPYSRLNVDSDANYDARGFVDAMLRATRGSRPLFLAVHFESAHFPYRTRHATRVFHDANPFVAQQEAALTAVDAQIGRLMARLRRLGYLNDALVIVLSDHGEGLGEMEATTTQGGEPYQVKAYGHGADLMSEDENRTVLGLLQFRDGKPINAPTTRTDQVSLTDLRAVIERYVHSGQVALPKHGGCMTVETGIRLAAAANYKGLDPAKVAAEGAGYYEITQHGLLQLREDRIPALVATKDVGWRCRGELTFWSNAKQRYFAYQLLDDGSRLVEREPTTSAIAHVMAYRNALREAAGG